MWGYPAESGANAPYANPVETNRAKELLQQFGAQVSLDNTFISLKNSSYRAYKVNGQADPNKELMWIGNSQDRMIWLQMRWSVLTVTYEDGTISKFHIGTTPPQPEKRPEWPTLQSLQNKVNRMPWNVMQWYDMALLSKKTLTINPPDKPMEWATSKALILKNAKWWVDYSPGNNEDFTDLNWTQESDKSILSKYSPIRDVNWNVLNVRPVDNQASSVLNWKSATDWGKIVFTEKWIISICEQTGTATYISIDAPASAWASFGGMAKKPVIYLYPQKKTKISVSVELHDAQMVAEYPKSKDGKWQVEASPRGNLVDFSSGKKYGYLFWEAEKKWGFTLDTSKSDCVSSKDVEVYLEKSLKTLGLNTREANDFIVYWLPVLEKNTYSLIEWKTTEYTDMAKLHISPKPDTLIRVFMVFKKSDTITKTTPQKLQKARRSWYSVIEWGWSNLDEGKNIK